MALQQSHYEINVSLHGLHLFATAERSGVTREQTKRMYDVLAAKFPPKEGYSITLTYNEAIGRELRPSALNLG
jgi:hypothetical protein